MEPKTSHLARFQAMAAGNKEDFKLIGDCMIVEELPNEEVKTKSGLIVATGDVRQVDGLEMNRPLLARVLLVGEGYYDDETGKDVPLDTKPGDIILIGGADSVGIRWLSTFGPIISQKNHRIGLTRESEIKLRFSGQDAYDRVVSTLTGEAK